MIEPAADPQQFPERQPLADQMWPSPQPRAQKAPPDQNSSAPRHNHPQPDPGSARNGSLRPLFAPTPGAQSGGEVRRRLHLPQPQGNGGPHGSEPPTLPGATSSGSGPGGRPASRPSQHPNWQQAAGAGDGGADRALPIGASPRAEAGPGPIARHREKEGTAFIDQALRERVEVDINAFLTAFDAALADDNAESRSGLREATDRLLRAGARTRIELERLEARAPLPSRDKEGQAPPLFRR